MLQTEKRFIDSLLQTGLRVPAELRALAPHLIVRLLRKRLRMTQRQLAKRSSLPQSHIAKIESGKTTPSLESLQKLLGAMGCSVCLLAAPDRLPDAILQQQAHKAAVRRVRYVAGTMALEEQRPRQKALEELVLLEQKKLLDEESSAIWDDEP